MLNFTQDSETCPWMFTKVETRSDMVRLNLSSGVDGVQETIVPGHRCYRHALTLPLEVPEQEVEMVPSPEPPHVEGVAAWATVAVHSHQDVLVCDEGLNAKPCFNDPAGLAGPDL